MEEFKVLHYEYVLDRCSSYFREDQRYKNLSITLRTAKELISNLEGMSYHQQANNQEIINKAQSNCVYLLVQNIVSDEIEEYVEYDIDFVKRAQGYLESETKSYENSDKKKQHKKFVIDYLTFIIEDINKNTYKDWQKISKELTKEADDVLNDRLSSPVPITFLSYAFTDNVFAYYLYKLFKNNNGFLYVDSLMDDTHDNGKDIKKALFPWIDKSKQFLFLRSINSDATQIRQWCSWEFGNAYKKIDIDKFFYIQLGDEKGASNKLLDDFNRMHGINDKGYIF